MEVSANTELIAAFRKGDQDAARQIYKMYYRSLCYFSEKLIGDKAEAEDIAVDTFIKLFHKREDFGSLPEMKAFLFVAVRNACIDHLRKMKRRNKSTLEFEYLSERHEQFYETELIASKVLQLIYAEVELLPHQCKQVFKLIFIDNKSTSDIAIEMAISPQTVLNQKAKALQKLRLALQKEGLYSTMELFYCFLLFWFIDH